MKQIVLVRHATAGWGDPGSSDFDRPLTEQGHEEARRRAQQLRELGVRPDRLISSPARRAHETARAFVEAYGLGPDRWNEDPSLYEADLPTLLDLCLSLDDEEHCVLYVGHNPGFHAWAVAQSRQPPMGMPPATVVVLDFDQQSWAEVARRLADSKRVLAD